MNYYKKMQKYRLGFTTNKYTFSVTVDYERFKVYPQKKK